jgi:hypothetical protein
MDAAESVQERHDPATRVPEVLTASELESERVLGE